APRYSLIDKQVLQFHRLLHPDWLETVTRPPVPQHNMGSNLIRIVKLAARMPGGHSAAPPVDALPGDSHAFKLNLAPRLGQIQGQRSAFEWFDGLRPKPYSTVGLPPNFQRPPGAFCRRPCWGPLAQVLHTNGPPSLESQ